DDGSGKLPEPLLDEPLGVGAAEPARRPELLAQVQVVDLLVADRRQVGIDRLGGEAADRTARLAERFDQVVLAGVSARLAGCHRDAAGSRITSRVGARTPRPRPG